MNPLIRIHIESMNHLIRGAELNSERARRNLIDLEKRWYEIQKIISAKETNRLRITNIATSTTEAALDLLLNIKKIKYLWSFKDEGKKAFGKVLWETKTPIIKNTYGPAQNLLLKKGDYINAKSSVRRHRGVTFWKGMEDEYLANVNRGVEIIENWHVALQNGKYPDYSQTFDYLFEIIDITQWAGKIVERLGESSLVEMDYERRQFVKHYIQLRSYYERLVFSSDEYLMWLRNKLKEPWLLYENL